VSFFEEHTDKSGVGNRVVQKYGEKFFSFGFAFPVGKSVLHH